MFIEMRRQYDDFYILHCEGSLVPGPEMEYVQSKLDEITNLACARLLVDFEDVTAIGSLGVTFIVTAYTSVMRQPGGRFVVTGVNPRVKHVLDLTRISTLIPLASDLPSGLSMLGAETALAPKVLSNCISAGPGEIREYLTHEAPIADLLRGTCNGQFLPADQRAASQL